MNPRTAAAVPLALLTLTTAACESPAGPGPEPAPEEITELPRALSVAETQAIEATNEFGLELVRRLYADPLRSAPNVFISPLSASMSLGMALAGAAGDTYDAMVDALALEGLTEEEIYRSYQDLLELLHGLDPSVELEIANVAWLASTYSFLPEYRARVQEAFDARLESFTPGDAEAVEAMNRWVAEVTRGYITELLQPGDIRPSTIAALLNAVYFEADWRTRFSRT